MPKGKKRTTGRHPRGLAGLPVWAWVVLTAGGLVAAAGVAVMATGGLRTRLVGGPVGGPAAAVVGPAPLASGTRYVPHESERKLADFLKGKNEREVTLAEVLAVMGEPTRWETVTGRRAADGKVITVQEAFWEVPGSGIRSQIGFVDGRVDGMVLGLVDKR